MKELEYVLAQKEDLENVLAMFTSVINEMNRNGIDQWDSMYPSRYLLEEDIIKRQLFIGLYKGTVVSA